MNHYSCTYVGARYVIDTLTDGALLALLAAIATAAWIAVWIAVWKWGRR